MMRIIRQSKLFSLLAKLGFTVAALWLVCRNIDFSQLREMLHHQNLLLLMTASALMFCQVPLGAWRWQLILAALGGGRQLLCASEAFIINYITAFFNCCLPGTVGADAVRVWLTKSDHVALPLAIHSVIIDRVIALAALGCLVVFTLPWLSALAGFSITPVLLTLAVTVPLGLWLLLNMRRLLNRYRHLRLMNILAYFTDSLSMMLKHRAISILSLAYGIVSHLFYCMCSYVLAHSLGIDITLMQCITLIPPVMLASYLPVSVGGWGVREAGAVGMLALAGIPHEQALMLSIQLGLIPIAVNLPAGLLWLVRRKPGGISGEVRHGLQ